MIRLIFLIILGILYTIMPFDFLPDLLPPIGWVDDIFLWIIIYWFFLRPLTRKVKDSGEPHSETSYSNNKDESDYNWSGRAAEEKNPYRVLGLSENASQDMIKLAYRQLAAKYHPDKVAHLGEEFQVLAEERFKEIQDAYQRLSKP